MKKKMLIVYYSVSNGNTKKIAEILKNETGADICRIETASPYTGSYDDVVSQGQHEVESGYEPEIKPFGVDQSAYDIIALGTPTWWYTMAPAVRTFLSNTDLSDKTIVPFQTHGGWPGHVIRDIKNLCPYSNITLPFAVQFDSEGGPNLVTREPDIALWAKTVKEDLL